MTMHTAAEARMGKRGRPAKAGLREPNGRLARRPDLGTDQTRAKLAPNVIGDIGEGLHAQAAKIASAYALITADVVIKPGAVQRVSPSRHVWTDGQSWLVERYCDWVEELGRRKLPYLALMAMILENASGPRDVLAKALRLYARIDRDAREAVDRQAKGVVCQ